MGGRQDRINQVVSPSETPPGPGYPGSTENVTRFSSPRTPQTLTSLLRPPSQNLSSFRFLSSRSCELRVFPTPHVPHLPPPLFWLCPPAQAHPLPCLQRSGPHQDWLRRPQLQQQPLALGQVPFAMGRGGS